jgi:hypothetical protein
MNRSVFEKTSMQRRTRCRASAVAACAIGGLMPAGAQKRPDALPSNHPADVHPVRALKGSDGLDGCQPASAFRDDLEIEQTAVRAVVQPLKPKQQY